LKVNGKICAQYPQKGRLNLYFWLWAILPEEAISCIACSRHFTSSVGHKTREEKIEATEPAHAFCMSLYRTEMNGKFKILHFLIENDTGQKFGNITIFKKSSMLIKLAFI